MKRDWRRRVFAVLALAALAPWARRAVGQLARKTPEDFIYYYTGSGLYWRGLNPYDQAGYQTRLEARLGGANELPSRGSAFLYPPLMAWLFGPLTRLPFVTSYVVWSAFLGVCVAAVWGLLAWGAGFESALMLGGLLLAFPGTDASLFQHRVTWPLLAALLAGWALLDKKREAAAGLCLGLLAAQPQWGAVAALGLALGRRWKALAWFAAPTLISFTPYLLGLRPAAELAGYAAAVSRMGGQVSLGGLSLAACIERLFDPRWTSSSVFLDAPSWYPVLWLLSVACFAAALAWIWRRKLEWREKAEWTFALALAVQPYSNGGDALWLLPWLCGVLRRGWPSEPACFASLLCAALLTLGLRFALDSTLGHGWIGLAYLALGAAAYALPKRALSRYTSNA